MTGSSSTATTTEMTSLLRRNARRRFKLVPRLMVFAFVVSIFLTSPKLTTAEESGGCKENLTALNVELEAAQVELVAKRSDLQKSVEIADSLRAEARQNQETLASYREDLEKCKKSLAEKSCAAVEKELTDLLEARREMATDLEAAKQREAQLKATNADLESRVDVLNVASKELGSTKSELSQAKTDVNSFKAQIKTKTEELDAVNQKIKKAGEERRKLINTLDEKDSKIDNLNYRLEHAMVDLANRSRKEYIFSFEQLVQNVGSFATFIHGVGRYTAATIFNAVSSRVPPKQQAQAKAMYQTQRKKAEQLVEMHLQPHVVKLRRLVETNELAQRVQDAFAAKVMPAVSAARTHLERSLLAPAGAVLRKKARDANAYLDDVYVGPMLAAHPDLKPLIPATAVDRLCLLLFCVICGRLLLSSTCRAGKLLCCLACPWRWARLLRSGRCSSSGSKSAKTSRSRRKAFQPASGITSSSTTAGAKDSGTSERRANEKRRN